MKMDLPKLLMVFLVFCLVMIEYSVSYNSRYNELINQANIFHVDATKYDDRIDLIKIDSLTEFQNGTSIKILIHGFMASKDHASIIPVRNALLVRGGNTAVFVCDWSEAAGVQYFDSRFFVKPVGIRFAKIIENFISKYNVKLEDIHIIGHSLGAHIAGNIGNYFNGMIGRITGLDPAYPLFTEISTDDLRSSAAKFIDVIHSGSQILGDISPRGHADFYPNFGYSPQPGCQIADIISLGGCSHLRACLLYAESVLKADAFPSVQCPLNQIQTREIRNCPKMRDATVVRMGDSVPTTAKGSFFLSTNSVPPYGISYNIVNVHAISNNLERK